MEKFKIYFLLHMNRSLSSPVQELKKQKVSLKRLSTLSWGNPSGDSLLSAQALERELGIGA